MRTDAIGQRGEAIFTLLITDYEPGGEPIFKPQFLGDKWPLIDFIVELVGNGASTPFFFVQVKTTRKGYRKREKRLRIEVTQDHVRALAAYPAPTYIVGIDEEQETGYIVSANGENTSSLSSMTTLYPIDQKHRELLWTEVEGFWGSYRPITSQFVDVEWR